MSRFSSDDQWRSLQTFVAAYFAGMHPLDVFTISRRTAVSPPVVEFRWRAEGTLRFSIGDLAWSDEPGEFIVFLREDFSRADRPGRRNRRVRQALRGLARSGCALGSSSR